MKASDLKPGDVIDGWTVTKYIYAEQRGGEGDDWQPMVLLTLELRQAIDGYDVNGDPVYPGDDIVTSTRRHWYRADEDVEVER